MASAKNVAVAQAVKYATLLGGAGVGLYVVSRKLNLGGKLGQASKGVNEFVDQSGVKDIVGVTGKSIKVTAKIANKGLDVVDDVVSGRAAPKIRRNLSRNLSAFGRSVDRTRNKTLGAFGRETQRKVVRTRNTVRRNLGAFGRETQRRVSKVTAPKLNPKISKPKLKLPRFGF